MNELEAGREQPDLTAAEVKWGPRHGSPTLRMRDALKLAQRLPLARRLGAQMMHDPVAGWRAARAIRRYRAMQKPLELAQYLQFLRQRPLRRALEIGTLWGGTFYAHCMTAAPDAHLIAIDSFPRENAESMTRRFQELARPGQQVTCLWNDSHADTTRQSVSSVLGGQSLDLLFIDGDHSHEGVHRDYSLYSPLVRRGGLIAFHDIDAPRSDGVPVLWRTLKNEYQHVEFVDRLSPPQGLGIGVLITH